MQRQLALQRLQEQEREMQMRFEQQKHLTQIRQMQAYGYPSNVRLMHHVKIMNLISSQKNCSLESYVY